jgi:hypothetical protein
LRVAKPINVPLRFLVPTRKRLRQVDHGKLITLS